MADGIGLAPADDSAEAAALADEARLIRRVRLRLLAWSGFSTLLVLVVLGAALYTVVANTLAGASMEQLRSRIDPIVAALTGNSQTPGDPRDQQGFLLGTGNTLLFIFDSTGQPVQLGDRRFPVPAGLPDAQAIAAAAVAADGSDVRLMTLLVNSSPVQTVPIRVLTQKVVWEADGSTYFLEVMQDRSTEVGTLQALLTVLLVGGLVVVLVAIGFGAVYARRALVPIRQSLADQRTALRRQRQFAADASHELRTPLTVIRSSVEHLQRHPERRVADQREALDDIEAEVGHLGSLVDDLLILARSDSGAVSLELAELDLGDVAFEAASSFERTASERGVTVGVDPEPGMVRGDSARLRQLVMILVDNAVRHSPRGGRVDVTVRAAGAFASVEVADEGPGLREEDMPHVFDRFWRAPGAPSGGTGLGLAIARWIADTHGGRIGVANRPSGGAVFRVELPSAEPGAPSAPSAPSD